MLTLADVLPIDVFVAQRRKLEAEIVAVKGVRRLAAGPEMTWIFENRATCLWQVQEMCRVEGITSPAAVQHELDTYNALLPTASELSATLLIEIDDPAVRAVRLRAMLGLHDHVRLTFAGAPDAPARFDAEQFNTERISAVQFVRFPLTSSQIEALRDLGRPATLAVTHPAYPVSTPLPLTLRAALVDDLGHA